MNDLEEGLNEEPLLFHTIVHPQPEFANKVQMEICPELVVVVGFLVGLEEPEFLRDGGQKIKVHVSGMNLLVQVTQNGQLFPIGGSEND